jgi:hypothetical protein
MSTNPDPITSDPVAEAGLEAAQEAIAAPAAPKPESDGEKILHGLEDVGEVAGEVAIGGLVIAAEAANPEGAEALEDSEPHPGHHGK